jgi:hypothetical protein
LEPIGQQERETKYLKFLQNVNEIKNKDKLAKRSPNRDQQVLNAG